MERTPPPVGAFVIRAWFENQDPNQFRARIIYTVDVTSNSEVVTAATTTQTVHERVDEWLEALQQALRPESE